MLHFNARIRRDRIQEDKASLLNDLKVDISIGLWTKEMGP